MSRVGKIPVDIVKGVTVDLSGNILKVSGSKGNLAHSLPEEISINIKDDQIHVIPKDKNIKTRAMWGLTRKLIYNMVHGVSEGYNVLLDITGVGFKAAVTGEFLTLSLGYSHDIVYLVPDGISVKCPKPTSIEISGINKCDVGQVVADIKALRKHDPYKGKGVRIAGEFVRRKEGKKK